VEKLKVFPKENQEKKQLEEIAHLYFSDPSPSSETTAESERPFESSSLFPRALFVQCAAGRPEEDLSAWFLFNLAVMLKILNGPVLVIGSECTYEKRFLFGFRPDRERLMVEMETQMPSGSFGPMGLCLLDSRVLWRGLRDERDVYPVDPMAGGRVGFRYILSDEAPSGGVFRSLPSLVLLLVTPTTMTPALLEDRVGVEDGLFPAHAGIVVAGAGCAEEADALFVYWRDRLRERCEGELAVEDWGRLHWDDRIPWDALPADVGMSGVGVLEDPESVRARFCQTAASRIRKKRLELFHGVA
jgi:hypothetical protein